MKRAAGSPRRKRSRRHPSRREARGEAIHAWLARIEWLDTGPMPTDGALLAEARALGVTDADATAALARFRRAIELPAVRSALSRADAAARVGAHASIEALRERPFAVRDPRPPADGLLVGRFDRLVVARDERSRPVWAEVIDFKTDAPRGEPDAFLLAQRAHHRPQMEAYRLAASRMLGLAPERIGARLVFTSLGRVVEAE